MTVGYQVPTAEASVEIEVKRSRFIGFAASAPTVEAARAFIDSVRRRYPDASHHVYAFEVGHGATITHGMSDDGEPSGTAGRPALVVVEHDELGDVVVVVVRYFGGTKLGTGGLVRAYTQAVQQVLAIVPRELKVHREDLIVHLPYERYEICRVAIGKSAAIEVVEEKFSDTTCLHLRGPKEDLVQLRAQLTQLTAGRLVVEQDS
ncbi:MAG: YigZ family protein [Gemmatimonadetes bacterium]|nr:YigZ family protein [Gemmatimonadota bacterium]MBT5055826.1 YigZ family protein [Gemmatimonadota bacterium]MBT5143741.1 YigZ family protein [Gemmatimonadota bacterium]MBT5590508.1 YigZ family protein [Gemmatimonadota bacterium]MBT5965621.1 YigZ family protein [Gemmatimonadota bacterium]